MKLSDTDPRGCEFINALESNGWTVETKPKLDWSLVNHWWIADVWTARSVWSPNGFKVFIVWINNETVGEINHSFVL